MNEIDREAKPIVYDWPVGYCDNTTHWGMEHPLYTSSDNGCTNFVRSERLLEIKQLFDQAAQLAALRDELELAQNHAKYRDDELLDECAALRDERDRLNAKDPARYPDTFRACLEYDDNFYFRVPSGHVNNALDEALAEIERLKDGIERAVERISSNNLDDEGRPQRVSLAILDDLLVILEGAGE